MLKLPDYSKPFRIDLAADAGDVAVGAELLQNGQPVAFYRKKLTSTEARYHVTDRELLAINQVCMKWKQYLHGHNLQSTQIIIHLPICTLNPTSIHVKPDAWSD